MGLKLDTGGGLIRDLAPSGPVGAAGLLAGDRITHVNGTVSQSTDLQHTLARASAPYPQIQLNVERNVQQDTATMRHELTLRIREEVVKQVGRLDRLLLNAEATLHVVRLLNV